MQPGTVREILKSARFRVRLIWLAPILALIALSAWAFASPMGASPDDDYHLVSIWCSQSGGEFCLPGSSDGTRFVPRAVLESPCFAFSNPVSASCQDALDFGSGELVETNRGNFSGAYPPLYYSVMSIFVSGDPLLSVIVMRLFNVLLFVSITTALYVLLPLKYRPALVLGWLITTMPLGLFLLASNNPSGWAVAGVGSAWLALVGYYDVDSLKQRIALGCIFVLAVLMGAGSRGDAAMYVAGAIGVAGILSFVRSRRFLVLSLLPLTMLAVSAAFFLSSRQTASGLSGFSGGSNASSTAIEGATNIDGLAGFGLLVYNLVNVPSLWTGVFGGWYLGWLDTPVSTLVMVFAVAVFIGVGFAGLSVLNRRKAFVLAGVGVVLLVLPTYVLTQGGDKVGEQVQPRYILPLIVLIGGLALVQAGHQRVQLGRLQASGVVFALTAANLVALHMNMRRYVTGIEVPGWNLNRNIEWFWAGAPAPMVVWAAGAIAYSALVAILIREISKPHVVGAADPNMSSTQLTAYR